MDYIEQKVVESVTGESVPVENVFLTPLNVILVLVLAYTMYSILSPSKPYSLAADPPAIVFRTFTPQTLLPFNGHASAANPEGSVYLAVRGRVFDVSSGRNFYGLGGPYENFAGRDASRGLACHSFDKEMLTEDLDGPLDKLEGLGEEDMDSLKGWEERFEAKYIVVGRLVSVGDYEDMVKGKERVE